MAQPTVSSSTRQKTIANPGVKIPPPAIYILAMVAGWLAQRQWPMPFIAHDTALWVGLAFVAVGLVMALMSIITMLRGHGAVNTNLQSSALVVSGIYRISRNPMYVALTLMYIGFAISMSLPWSLILLPFILIFIQTVVIAREEASLEKTFGQPYTDYKARVRRWL
jgi:protein-S-isoprenylcysteine O-methyltransferase Ste14